MWSSFILLDSLMTKAVFKVFKNLDDFLHLDRQWEFSGSEGDFLSWSWFCNMSVVTLCQNLKTQYTDYAVWDMIDLLDFTSVSMKENIIF